MNKKTSFIFLMCALTIFAASGAYAQSVGPVPTSVTIGGGISSCQNMNGALSTSVGTIGAMGGAFVPVNDAAVTLNTGILVYKECVLRTMIDAERKDAVARLVRDTTGSFLNGRCVVDADGLQTCGPMFPENLAADKQKLGKTVVTQDVNGNLLNMVPSLYQNDVKTAITRNYAQQTQNPGSSLACSYRGTPAGLAAIHGGAFNGPQDLFAIADPNCNPLFSFFNAQSLVMSDVAAQQNDMLTRLGWNNGVYDVTATDANGVSRVVTPGYLVAGTMQQQLGSSFRQLENANDLGQMIDNLFAGIGRQVISSGVGGLQGLISAQFGQRSYLDAVVANTGAAVQSSAADAAMQNLVAAVKNETDYLATKNATASLITQAAAQLRAKENQCWSQLIIPAVITYAQDPKNGISRLAIATTTTASQAVIDSNFAPLASSTVTEISISNATVDRINKIITGVNSANPADAYNQLNLLVASGALHTSYDVQNAQRQMKDVQSALTAVVTDTITAWSSNVDTSVGWCNVNNPALVAKWANAWNK